MKIVHLPMRIFETGDRVLTPEGEAIVIHDELESIQDENYADEEIMEKQQFRDTVIVRLDEPTSRYPLREDIHFDRNNISILEEEK